jgi:hypothetical protein
MYMINVQNSKTFCDVNVQHFWSKKLIILNKNEIYLIHELYCFEPFWKHGVK